MLARLTKAGGKGHQYDYLLSYLRKPPIHSSLLNEAKDQLRRVDFWSTELRHEVHQIPAAVANQFLVASKWLVDWAERS